MILQTILRRRKNKLKKKQIIGIVIFIVLILAIVGIKLLNNAKENENSGTTKIVILLQNHSWSYFMLAYEIRSCSSDL